MIKFSSLLVFILFVTTAFGQQKLVNGFLRDSVTLLPIVNGTIKNSNTNKTVTSNSKGFFKIEAAANDLLYASAKSYRYDTLLYSLMYTDTITIYLPFSGNVLPTVTVKGQYTRYQLDSIERKKAFEQSIGTVQKTLASDHPGTFGLSFNLDKAFKKKYKNQQSGIRTFNMLEKMEYVNYRFSPNLVAYYTGFKGDKLRNFMTLYTPSFDWLRQHPTNEDVMYYINDMLKEFRTTGAKPPTAATAP